MSTELEGLRALVTGGASGIGLATARLLAARGAEVAVLDLDPSDVEMPLLGFKADVSDDGSVRAAVDSAAAALGGLDILVNNAGIGAAGTVEDNDDEQWHRVLDVNVLGIVRTTRAALPPARLRTRGDRQHVLDRGHGRAAAAGAVLRQQGRGALTDPGHGRRPCPRGDPRQLRQPRDR
jgi:NAD(P)-dependent dehydrogenase (short-subunit alcohol dehydrogenase family)